MSLRVDQVQKDLIRKLIVFVENEGINTGYATRLSRAGEWGLSFQEVFYAAKSDEKVFLRLREPLIQLNQFFSNDKYLSENCGFPMELPQYEK